MEKPGGDPKDKSAGFMLTSQSPCPISALCKEEARINAFFFHGEEEEEEEGEGRRLINVFF